MTQPSDKALVPFVSVDNMMRLVHHISIQDMLRGLTDYSRRFSPLGIV